MTTTKTSIRGWQDLLGTARGVFTVASFSIFETLMAGWALAPGRRTITAMICAADSEGHRAHDAYHRFVRCGRWSMDALWRVLVVRLVETLCRQGVIPLDLDDTLFKKTGRRVEGAGIFRDAVRSTRSKVVYALGLNLVVVTLRVTPPWGGCPVALPVGVALHRKGGPTTVELACQMMRQLAEWLPDRSFSLCADGAYATLIGRGLRNTVITSRLRRDAAIYEAAPPKTGKRGRPKTKGERLATPAKMAEGLAEKDFAAVEFDCRGRTVTSLVWSRRVLWYYVDKTRMVTLVVVRDPDGACPDDFFMTDYPDATATQVVARYVGRWSIEICFREVKQVLGAEDPQSWKGEGPERAAALSFWLYSAIWAWYLPTFGAAKTWIPRPWYKRKATPSFLDALAALRRALWTERITPLSSSEPLNPKIIDGLLDVLTRAA